MTIWLVGQPHLATTVNTTQCVPSYMAVMLNMTDTADGFPLSLHVPFPFYPAQSAPCTLSTRRSSLVR